MPSAPMTISYEVLLDLITRSVEILSGQIKEIIRKPKEKQISHTPRYSEPSPHFTTTP